LKDLQIRIKHRGYRKSLKYLVGTISNNIQVIAIKLYRIIGKRMKAQVDDEFDRIDIE
jgi:hypothetical protein